MGDQQSDEREVNPITAVGKRAHRYSKEFLATTISVVGTALGVVVALAWNTALAKYFAKTFKSQGSEVVALFVYAVTITAIAVVAIVVLGKLARRLDAEPIQFKYPDTDKG